MINKLRNQPSAPKWGQGEKQKYLFVVYLMPVSVTQFVSSNGLVITE
jgi:hypothetical protein